MVDDAEAARPELGGEERREQVGRHAGDPGAQEPGQERAQPEPPRCRTHVEGERQDQQRQRQHLGTDHPEAARRRADGDGAAEHPQVEQEDRPSQRGGREAQLGHEERGPQAGQGVVDPEARAVEDAGPDDAGGQAPSRGGRGGRGGGASRLRPRRGTLLLHHQANGHDQQRRERSHQEQQPPALGADGGVGERGQDVAHAPASLQHARGQAAGPGRPALHGQRRAAGPLGPHAEPEQRPQEQHHAERGREGHRAVAGREPEDRDHERQPASEPVGEPPGREPAREPHQQREGDAEGGGHVRDAELPGDVLHREQEDAEVEAVEDPASPGGEVVRPLGTGGLAPPGDGGASGERGREVGHGAGWVTRWRLPVKPALSFLEGACPELVEGRRHLRSPRDGRLARITAAEMALLAEVGFETTAVPWQSAVQGGSFAVR